VPIDPAVYREMGLSDHECQLIVDTLGREPSYTEIGMYSVMWSEHCGYKYSRPVLKLFSEYRKAQETGALENAGVVPLGDTGYGIVFKMESHNHPSAVEPHQGAATGVGGILRDIFTMGAQPIASLDSLRFGPITGDGAAVMRNRYLFEHVVAGVGGYGNCLTGDAAFVWRDAAGHVRHDTIGAFVEANLPVGLRQADLPRGTADVLSATHGGRLATCWMPVRRVFRHQADTLLRIVTTDGVELRATLEHPFLVVGASSEERIRFASALKPGDMLPVLADGPALAAVAAGLAAGAIEAAALGVCRTRIEAMETITLPGGCDVYDVEVDETHLFVTTGGIVTHNCVGVPTVGGEITFHPSYNGNPLVNAMSVGVVRMDGIASARAAGIGNPVLYVGSSTGRDGIHGATFASVELTEESEARRPNVQVGDPFLEKLLIEATLEALATGHIVGIQDMGAAGLTCGTCEMSAKGAVGMEIDVQRVPRREQGMTAYEVMLSESQERMLAVVDRGHEEEVAAVFRKWGLNAAYIGFVTDTGRVVVRDGGTVAADVPARSLADDCPTYNLDAAEPAYIARVRSADLSGLPEPDDYGDVLLRLLSAPSIASKRWVWEQYDTMVQTQTEVLPGAGDAAVLSVRAAGGRRIAVTTDCNPRFCYLDPFVGAQLAVAEAARNLSCVGAVPKAVTDCLNFPSPEKPEGFWQFRRAVEGMAAACDALGTQVVSGNVSFYNETPDGAIYPTPTVGMVGVFDDGVTPVGLAFQTDGDLLYLLRPAETLGSDSGLGGSEYLSLIHGREEGRPPHLDLASEARVQAVTRQAIVAGLLRSAHDCSDGGIAVALAESCLAGGRGAEVRFAITDFVASDGSDLPWSAILYGEAASRIVVSVRPGVDQDRLLDLAEAEGTEAVFLGQVKDNGRFDAAGLIDLPLCALRDAYEGAIPRAMDAELDLAA
jgi:phosphoribosylformylglycinamidine synthase